MNSEVSVIANSENEKYIEFDSPTPIWFIDMNVSILKNHDLNISREKKMILCHSYSIESLEKIFKKNEFLSYEECVRLVGSFAETINYLLLKNLTILNIDLSDFLKIEKTFIFINFSKIIPSLGSDLVNLNKKIIPTEFTPPELRMIPPQISNTSIFYNIASIISALVIGDNVDNFSHDQWREFLNPIYHTRLYWFLLRCLSENYDQRSFLFV